MLLFILGLISIVFNMELVFLLIIHNYNGWNFIAIYLRYDICFITGCFFGHEGILRLRFKYRFTVSF